jgi:hypothetical protein
VVAARVAGEGENAGMSALLLAVVLVGAINLVIAGWRL